MWGSNIKSWTLESDLGNKLEFCILIYVNQPDIYINTWTIYRTFYFPGRVIRKWGKYIVISYNKDVIYSLLKYRLNPVVAK